MLVCFELDHRDVAQLGRALRSGRKGRRFESCHPDQTNVDRGTARITFLGLFVLLLYNSYPPVRCLRSVRPPICLMLLRRRRFDRFFCASLAWRRRFDGFFCVFRARFINFYLSGPDFGFVFSKISIPARILASFFQKISIWPRRQPS